MSLNEPFHRVNQSLALPSFISYTHHTRVRWTPPGPQPSNSSWRFISSPTWYSCTPHQPCGVLDLSSGCPSPCWNLDTRWGFPLSGNCPSRGQRYIPVQDEPDRSPRPLPHPLKFEVSTCWNEFNVCTGRHGWR